MDFTSLKRVSIEQLVPTGKYLSNREKSMIREKRHQWKEKLIAKSRRQGNMDFRKQSMRKDAKENKQYIHVFSGGLVRPK